MLQTPLRKRDLPTVPEKTMTPGAIQKSRSRQKIRSRSKGITQATSGQSYQLSKKNQSIKAYHFSNSIYQGEVRAFHRVGKGMIIHDNGLTGLIRSGTNRLKEHNVFFGHNIIISVIYKERELDFVYKNGNRFLVLNMQIKGEHISLNSIGYLVELDLQRVSRLKFKNDSLVEKVVLTREQIDEIINKEKFQKIMRQQHIQALKFNLFDPSFSNIQIIPKFRNQIHIGFTQTQPTHYSTTYQLSFQQKDYHNRNLQGLGMILQKVSHDSNKHFRYQTRVLERGFYSKGRLEYFGQMFYVNGNHYFGGIKDQEIHGNGILVYESQNRFAVGKFNQGKPLYLDQSSSYRLDTEQGRALYAVFRRRLHSQDPQVWIDGQVLDLPDLQYFRYKLHECCNFKYLDQEVKNYLKQQEELRLSRKVEDFQKEGRSSRTLSDRKSMTVSFGQKDETGMSKMPNLMENRDLAAQINRQVQQQGLKKTIGHQLANNQLSPLFPLGPHNNTTQPFIQTPIRRIQTDNFQPTNNGLQNPQINGSIIQGFNFDGINSSSSNKNSRIIISSENDKKSPLDDSLNGFTLTGKNSLPLSNDKPPAYNISVRSPIEGSRVSQHSIPRSASRSASRSLSRGSSKSIGKKRNLFQESQQFIKTFQRSPLTNQKRSILDRLYGEANNRAQILQREYAMLEKRDQARYSPNSLSAKRVSPGRIPSNLSPSPNKTYNYTGYSDEPTQMDVKLLVASSQALKLAHSNKVKEEKFQQYEHIYTHKKRFDYTSESYDQRGGRPYGNINVLSKQTHFERTPEKRSKYDHSASRSSKKEVIDGLVNRLYPKHSAHEYTRRPQQIYDSRYQQEQPLNRYGLVRGEERKIRQSQPEESFGRYSYGKDFKGSVLRNNTSVRS